MASNSHVMKSNL